MTRTLGTGETDRELDIALLKTSVETALDLGATPMLMKILKRRADAILRKYPRKGIPDWVEALSRGDADQPAVLLQWLLEHMEIEAEIDIDKEAKRD